MRIVQVIHWFLPRHTAGSEVYTYQLARALSERHQVSIYCREEGHAGKEFYAEDQVFDGLPVRRVYYNPPPGPCYMVRKALTRFCNPRIEADFGDYLAHIRPDVVHFQHLFKLSARLIPIARSKGIPCVVTLHDYWFLCYNGQLLQPGWRVCSGPRGGLRCPGCAELSVPPILRLGVNPLLCPLFIYRTWLLRRCLHQADAIISPSNFLAGVFLRHGLPRFGASRPWQIRVSDNGIDVAWQAAVARNPGSRVRFGYIGTIAPHKGVHILVEAFRAVDARRAELWVYGDLRTNPAYSASLRAQADGAPIEFKGPFAHEDIAQILSGLDVLVVPSLWPENSPLTIHEARAARLPVLASDIGGIPELVREGRAGWLFRPGDVENLRRHIIEIVEAPEILLRLREEIQPVKTIEENAHELESLYASLATRPVTPRASCS